MENKQLSQLYKKYFVDRTKLDLGSLVQLRYEIYQHYKQAIDNKNLFHILAWGNTIMAIDCDIVVKEKKRITELYPQNITRELNKIEITFKDIKGAKEFQDYFNRWLNHDDWSKTYNHDGLSKNYDTDKLIGDKDE